MSVTRFDREMFWLDVAGEVLLVIGVALFFLGICLWKNPGVSIFGVALICGIPFLDGLLVRKIAKKYDVNVDYMFY